MVNGVVEPDMTLALCDEETNKCNGYNSQQ